MSVLVHEVTGSDDGRIFFGYEGANGNLAAPYDGDPAAGGEPILFDPATAPATIGAPNQNTGIADASFTQTLTSDGCNARAFVISLASTDAGAQLQNITVANLDAAAVCDTGGEGEGEGEDVAEGCSCSG